VTQGSDGCPSLDPSSRANSCTSRDYYLLDGDKYVALRKAYKDFVVRVQTRWRQFFEGDRFKL